MQIAQSFNYMMNDTQQRVYLAFISLVYTAVSTAVGAAGGAARDQALIRL